MIPTNSAFRSNNVVQRSKHLMTNPPQIGATAYLEVSTTENLNLNQLQDEIVKIILHTKPKKTSNFSFGIVKFLLGR